MTIPYLRTQVKVQCHIRTNTQIPAHTHTHAHTEMSQLQKLSSSGLRSKARMFGDIRGLKTQSTLYCVQQKLYSTRCAKSHSPDSRQQLQPQNHELNGASHIRNDSDGQTAAADAAAANSEIL